MTPVRGTLPVLFLLLLFFFGGSPRGQWRFRPQAVSCKLPPHWGGRQDPPLASTPHPTLPWPPGAPTAVWYCISKACSSTKCIYKSLRMFFFILKLTIIFYCEKCRLALDCFKLEEKGKEETQMASELWGSSRALVSLRLASSTPSQGWGTSHGHPQGHPLLASPTLLVLYGRTVTSHGDRELVLPAPSQRWLRWWPGAGVCLFWAIQFLGVPCQAQEKQKTGLGTGQDLPWVPHWGLAEDSRGSCPGNMQ